MTVETFVIGTVGLCTLGCKVAQYETEAIGEEFARRGFSLRPFEDVCDIYLINTCTVTAESDRKSRQMIRRAAKRNPEAVIAVTGCYSQTSPDEVARIDGVCVVTGSRDKLRTVTLAVDAWRRKRAGETVTPSFAVGSVENRCIEGLTVAHAPRTRAYVKIEDGCESRCSYCRIPAARGQVCSKPPEEVIREVEALAASGTREVVLTGIETGSYGADFSFSYRLCDLLRELDARGSCERIRLGSLAPELCGESFAEGVRGLSILAPHFHLSMQSGSDRILGRMRRRYNRAGALANIARLREVFPTAQFTTDLMVGFPSEGEEDFAQTLSFVEEARLLDAHVFAYSPRPGTPAADFPDQVSPQIKRQRSERLIAEKNRVRREVLEGLVAGGVPLSVIYETREGAYMTAHSDTYVPVRVRTEENWHGQSGKVHPVYQKDGILYGEPMKI